MWVQRWVFYYICTHMATFTFHLRSKHNPSPIYLRLRNGRTSDIKVKTNLFVNPSDWSSAKGLPKIKNPNLKKLNSDLEKLKSDLVIELNEIKHSSDITPQWLSNFLNPQKNENALPEDLYNYIEYYIKVKKKDVEPASIRKWATIKQKLGRFSEKTKYDLSIMNIGNEFRLLFEQYLKEEGYAPNTIARTIKFIKQFCTHACENEIPINSQVSQWRVKFKKVENVFLNLEELKIIENTELDLDYLINARDWLIISCFVGQRVSDFLSFRKKMIKYQDGRPIIEFTQDKTEKIMALDLHPKVMKILSKRDGEFPRKISASNYNIYIKTVCKKAKLNEIVTGSLKDPKTKKLKVGKYEKWQLVSSHIGRRSYATNFYGKMPTHLLMVATGHTTEKALLVYIGKADTNHSAEIAEYYKKLYEAELK